MLAEPAQILSYISYSAAIHLHMICTLIRFGKIVLESLKFKKVVLPKFYILIKKICFQFNLDQTWSDCSTHEYYNLTKFGQDCTMYRLGTKISKNDVQIMIEFDIFDYN